MWEMVTGRSWYSTLTRRIHNKHTETKHMTLKEILLKQEYTGNPIIDVVCVGSCR
jgi:hypothetical protein